MYAFPRGDTPFCPPAGRVWRHPPWNPFDGLPNYMRATFQRAPLHALLVPRSYIASLVHHAGHATVEAKLTRVAIPAHPCIFCGGPEEDIGHMRLLCTRDEEVARLLCRRVEEFTAELPLTDRAV